MDYVCLQCRRTLTQVSRFEIPFKNEHVVGFCKGMFSLANNNGGNILYLWNPRIRKLKTLLSSTPLIHPLDSAAFGFGYNSQTKDYKILRLTCFKPALMQIPVEAVIYTLSTDPLRKSMISVESFTYKIKNKKRLTLAHCLITIYIIELNSPSSTHTQSGRL